MKLHYAIRSLKTLVLDTESFINRMKERQLNTTRVDKQLSSLEYAIHILKTVNKYDKYDKQDHFKEGPAEGV